MRVRVPSAILVTVIAIPSLAEEAPKLADETDRINYALGYQIGEDFKRQGIDLDAESVGFGIADGLTGTEPRLGREEMGALLIDLKRKITEDMRAEATARLEEKRKEEARRRDAGRAFLLANGQKEGVKTLPSGLQYKVLAPGNGRRPKASDRVSVHYRATTLDGHEFDSSYRKDAPASFRVDGTIPGLTEALQMMPEGAKWQVYLPPELAYGRQGPLAHQTVIFDLELLAVAGPGELPKAKDPH